MLVLALLLTVLPVNFMAVSAAEGDSPSYLLEDFEGETFNDLGGKSMYSTNFTTAQYAGRGPASDKCLFVATSLYKEKDAAKTYGPVFNFALRNGKLRGTTSICYTYDISVWIKCIYDVPADDSVTFVFTKGGTEYKTKVENAGLTLHEWVKVSAEYTHNVRTAESSPVTGDFYILLGDGKTTQGLTNGRQYALDDVTVIPREYYLDQIQSYPIASGLGLYTFSSASSCGTSAETAVDGFWVENGSATLTAAPSSSETRIDEINEYVRGKYMTITDDGSGTAKLNHTGVDYRNGVEYVVRFFAKGENAAALKARPVVTIDRTGRTDKENIKKDLAVFSSADIIHPLSTRGTKTFTDTWRQYYFIVRMNGVTYDTAQTKFSIGFKENGSDSVAGAKFSVANIKFFEATEAGRQASETLIAAGGIKGHPVGQNLYNFKLDNYVSNGNVTECITQLLVPCGNGEYALLKKFNNWENHEILQLSLKPEQAEGLVMKVTPKDHHEFYGKTYTTEVDINEEYGVTAVVEFDQTIWAPDMPTLSATVRYNSPTGSEDLKALCASYDEDGRMVSYDLQSFDIVQGEGEAKLTMDVSSADVVKTAKTARVFVWNDTDLAPVHLDDVEITKHQGGTFIYVHPDGAVNTTYGYNNPVPTVKAAVNAFSSVLKQNPNEEVYVILHPGYHFVSEPISIKGDMTSETGEVKFLSYDKNDKGIISGGMVVSGTFRYHAQSKALRCRITDLQNRNIRQIYVNGTRATRARYDGPFEGAVNTSTYNEYGYVAPGGNNNGKLGILKMDTDEKLLSVKRPQDLECSFYELWVHSRCGVDSITDNGDGTMTLNMTKNAWALANNMGNGHPSTPVWIENAVEFIDEPGEFYFNKSDGYLYYKPREGEYTLNSSGNPVWNSDNEVIIPILDNYKGAAGGGALIEFYGTQSNPVENITFDGVEFSHTTWSRPSTEYGHSCNQNNHKLDNPLALYESYTDEFSSPFEYGVLRSAAIDLMYADNIDFLNCSFNRMGSTAIRQTDGTDNSDIVGCEFFDISGNAITMGEPYQGMTTSSNAEVSASALAEERMLDNNTIENCYIHHVAVEYESAAAISLGHPRNVRVANNEICYIPYSGMHIGYGWDNVVESKLSGVVIEDNYIHDYFYSGVHDGGAIYTIGATGGTPTSPNVIRGNHIERVGSGAAGIYNDQGSSMWDVTENVVDLRDTTPYHIDGRFYGYSKWCNVNIGSAAYVDRYLTWTDNYATFKREYTPYYATHKDGNNTFEAIYLDEETGMWPSDAYRIIENAGITDEYRANFKYGLQKIQVIEKATLSAGETFANKPYLTGIGDLQYKSNELVIYVSSSNEAVATADTDNITAVGEGVAVITYTIIENGIVTKATTTVTVE